MKSKKLFKKWWFWLIIVLISIVFFYPKSCGFHDGFIPQGIECDCIGKKIYHYMDTVCYGICLKSTCPIIDVTYCEKDSDCRADVCSTNCVNMYFKTPEGLACALPPDMRANYCTCENNTCTGHK
jgi:hypothetical protein